MEGEGMNTEELEKVNARSIWLLLLAEGGRWKVSEIATELGASDPDLVHRFAHQMWKSGHLRKHVCPGEKLQYAVDKTCKIPMQLTMGDLMNAGALA